MNELLSFESMQTLKHTLPVIITTIVINALLIAVWIYTVKCDKLQKQSVIDSGIIARDLVRLEKQQSEIVELMVKSINQGIEIEILRQKKVKNKDLKSAFEDAVSELTELRSELRLSADEKRIAYQRAEALVQVNTSLRGQLVSISNNREYWKNRCLHQKHTSKLETTDSEWWTPSTTVQVYIQFELGKSYQKGEQMPSLNSLLYLVDSTGAEYLVHKGNFKPVKL